MGFEAIAKAFKAGKRWVAVEGLVASDAAPLFEFVRKIDSNTQWALLDDSKSAELRLDFKDFRPKVMVVDGLHWSDAVATVTAIKVFLKSFPTVQFVFLTPASIGQLEIPSYYGEGLIIFGESLNPESGSGRADSELLRLASRLTPTYGASDLVLGPITALKFQEALSYIRTKAKVENEWGFRKRHSRGHGVTVLLHGASGTGKTMAAEVLAAEMDLPLYQVELSSIVSKWVGETEKNLRAVFRAAEGVRGILLFDEGDALFGTRTDVASSQDRHSNMEVNFLLQEIERFNGILVLSTNQFKDMDPAFLRRFTYSITFGAPDEQQRKTIWERNLPAELPVSPDFNLGHLSQFELSGGNIKNCIRHAAARAASLKHHKVLHEDFLWAVKRECQKQGMDFTRELVGEKYWRRVGPEWESQKAKTGSELTRSRPLVSAPASKEMPYPYR